MHHAVNSVRNWDFSWRPMGKVLGIIYRTISTHLIHKAGYRLEDGATGAVTLIQRFGSALNLNMPQGTFS